MRSSITFKKSTKTRIRCSIAIIFAHPEALKTIHSPLLRWSSDLSNFRVSSDSRPMLPTKASWGSDCLPRISLQVIRTPLSLAMQYASNSPHVPQSKHRDQWREVARNLDNRFVQAVSGGRIRICDHRVWVRYFFNWANRQHGCWFARLVRRFRKERPTSFANPTRISAVQLGIASHCIW